MKAEHGFDLPRRLQIEFSKTIQHITEDSGTEISPVVMWDAFQREYLPAEPRYRLRSHELHTASSDAAGRTTITAQLVVDGAATTIVGEGDGPVEAFVARSSPTSVRRSTSSTTPSTPSARAPTPRPSRTSRRSPATTRIRWGIGTDPDITTASLRAVLDAFERQHG